MRFSKSLDDILFDASHLGVLRALCNSPTSGLTGREVARDANLSVAQTARVLRGLQDEGLISAQAAGKAFLWTWNPQHAWAESLQRLFRQETTLRQELISDLSRILRGSSVRRALLFGSIARGRERSDSDIDLFIETSGPTESEKVRQRISDSQLELWRKYGNPISPLILTSQEVRRAPDPALLRSIEQEGLPLEL